MLAHVGADVSGKFDGAILCMSFSYTKMLQPERVEPHHVFRRSGPTRMAIGIRDEVHGFGIRIH